ncbi:MAG TPA: galactose-1-phosphate uridylyltransferase [Kineosporiaceae bacterium]|nr:galactose-1-phosphate uridylyltransferase [Kineosporiaceae bacterium]
MTQVRSPSDMRRSVQRLADGREIIFFDRPGAAERVVDDPRPISPLTTASQIRRDPMLDEYVVIASHRQDRTYLPPADECPLDPSVNGRHTEIPTEDYEVVVFENRFPSLSGNGRCEVVCFSSDHNASFADLDADRVALVLAAWIDRTIELSALPSVEQVFCFENRGAEIGVTLSHPHGQIYAYPFITPRTTRMLEVAQRYQEQTNGRILVDDVVAEERQDGSRVIAGNEHWTAFVPQAARWPVEVHFYPTRRVPDLPALDDEQRAAFGPLYLDVLRRFDRLYAAPLPYIAAWHQAPRTVGRDLLGLHLEVFSTRRSADKLKFLAGSEAAMGAFIGDVTPEQTAARLRELAL